MSRQTLSRPVTLFYSYAHEDEDLRKQLEDHLSLLHRQGLLSSWHDRAILAGGNWAGEIDDHLNSADLILLLVSVAFLASDYLYDIEMQRALERHQRGEARVIPIILRHCDWSNAPFATLQVLPTDAQPVTQWHDRDEAWTDVTRGIRKALEELLNGKGKKETSLSEEQQLQPRSTSSLGKRLGQRAVILLGIALLIVLLLSAILWRYVPFIGDTSHRMATATRQATATMRAAMPSGSIYTVKNTSEDLTLPDGVYFRHSLQTDPSHPTPTPMFGFGVFKADVVQVSCWAWSDAVSGDRVWYYVYNVTRPTVAGRSNRGRISAHYVNDGMTANHPAPGIPQCRSPLPTGG